MKMIIPLILLFLSFSVSAQEICDNGIDDDGDGLIDLLDSDCNCTVLTSVPSFLPNPSFESYADNPGCNSFSPDFLPQDINQANCLDSWQQASDGTTDAWNSLSFSGAFGNFPDSIPLPLPDGQGAVGFWVGTNYGGDLSYREYIGACIGDNPLEAGVEYTLTFDLGFIFPEEDFNAITYSPSPVKIAIYGVESCNQLFFNGASCPEFSGAVGYQLLGEATVTGTPGEWSEVSVTFTPNTEINGITIGGSCDDVILPPVNFFSFGNYYLLDQLILNEKTEFEQLTVGPIMPNEGTWCDGDLTLAAPAFGMVTYQWYRDGIALVGETASSYTVPVDQSGLGTYEVLVNFGDSCGVSIPYQVALPVIEPALEDTIFLCDLFSSSISVPGASFGNGFEFLWEFNGTTSTEPIFNFNAEPGTIFLTISKDCVSFQDSIEVVLDGVASIETVASQTQVCGVTEVEIITNSSTVLNFVSYQDLTGNTLGFSFGNQPFNLLVFDDITVIGVTEVCGVLLTDTVNIQQGNEIQFSANVVPVSCGQSDGQIELTVPNNNLADLSIIWEDENGNTVVEDDFVYDGLSAGTYQLSLANTAGCSASATFLVEELLALEASLLTSDESCFEAADGSAELLVNGGNLPFTYQWLDSAGALVGNSEEVNNLSAGSYEVLATDATGCENTQQFVIEAATAIELQLFATNPECSGTATGTAAIQVTGGTPPYNYSWTTANGDVLSIDNSLEDLPAGAYELLVTDALACASSQTFELEPAVPLDIALTTSEPHCPGANAGTARVEVLSGLAPLNITWLDANGTPLSDGTEISNLPAGTFSILVSDANACTISQAFELTESTPINVQFSITDVNCVGTATGAAVVQVVNGVAPFTYQWLDAFGNVLSETDGVNDLLEGGYRLVVSDADGCSGTNDFVVQTQPGIQYNLVTVDDPCATSGEGLAYLENVNANAIATINWLDAEGNFLSSLDTLPNLSAGNYSVVIVDQLTCEYREEFQILAPSPIDLDVEISPIPCNQSTGGSIGLLAFGGTPPYFYSFQEEDNGPLNFYPNLAAGNYPIQVTDANGCLSALEEATIPRATETLVSLGGDQEVDLGEEVEVELFTIGFDNPIISWEPTEFITCENCDGFRLTPVDELLVNVRVEDENGCVDTDEINIRVNKGREVYIPNAFSPNGDGANDRFLLYPGQSVEEVLSYQVFNRWGAVVFESEGNEPWDGRFKGQLLDPGVYVWMAEVLFLDGLVKRYQGDVSLIR
ncbi:MAG: gliding motility-associated C-terminal domain-containing protein [Bacteroidota bacterium]